MSGTVKEGLTGIGQITVYAVPAGTSSAPQVYAHIHTNNAGVYSLPLEAPGAYNLFAVDERVPPSYQPAGPLGVTLVCGTNQANKDFAVTGIAPRGAIEATLRETRATASFQTLPGEIVTLGLKAGPTGSEQCTPAGLPAQTDSTGKATYANLPQGFTYCLDFTSAGYVDRAPQEQLLSGALATFNFDVKRSLVPVNGTVRDASGNAVISGVTVTASHAIFCPAGSSSIPAQFTCAATTDPQGGFTLSLPWDGGTYSLATSSASYQPGTKTASLSRNAPAGTCDGGIPWCKFSLSRVSVLMSGTVTLNLAGVSGATVCLSGISLCPVTSATGAYSLSVPWNTYTVTISGGGCALTVPGVILTAPGPNANNFDCTTTGTLTGTVRDADRSPIAGLSGVTVKFGGTACATTAADGTFTCTLTPATNAVSFEKTGWSVAPLAGQVVTSGTNLPLGNIDMQRVEGTITGAARDGSVAALPALQGATVTFTGSQVGAQGTTLTAADGSFSKANLPHDTYTVVLSLTNYQNKNVNPSPTITTGGGNVNVGNQDLLRDTGTISGTTKDDDASGDPPLAGVTVSFTGAATGAQGTANSGANGAFTKTLPFDTYAVSFAKAGYQTPANLVGQTVTVGANTASGTILMLRQTGTISGIVKESVRPAAAETAAMDDTPIVGLAANLNCMGEDVGAKSAAVTTVAGGAYGPIALPFDRYNCTLAPTGTAYYASSPAQQSDVPASGAATANFALDKRQWTLAGTVTDAATSGGLVGVTVCAKNAQTLPSLTLDCTTSGALGAYSIPLIYVQGTPRVNAVALLALTSTHHPGGGAVVFGPDVGSVTGTNNIALVPASITVSASPGLISGRVSDGNTAGGVGVPGLLVAAVRGAACSGPAAGAGTTFSTVTVGDGQYALPVPCDGSYTVSVTDAKGLYSPPTPSAAIVPLGADPTGTGVRQPGTVTKDFVASRVLGSAHVTVIDLRTQSPVAGASVDAAGVDTTANPAAVLTNGLGVATIANQPWGAYTATVSGPGPLGDWVVGGAQPGQAAFAVAPGQTSESGAALLRTGVVGFGGIILGRVADANTGDGAAGGAEELGVPGVVVTATRGAACSGAGAGAGTIFSAPTVADGRYAIAVPCDGAYTVSVADPKGLYQAPASGAANVPAGTDPTGAGVLVPGQATKDFLALRTTGSVHVTVVDLRTQTPVSGASVDAAGVDSTANPVAVLTNGAGIATIGPLPWGAYTATVTGPGAASGWVLGGATAGATGFAVAPAQTSESGATLVSTQPPTADCNPAASDPQVCQPPAQDPNRDLTSIVASRAGTWILVSPTLGQAFQGTGTSPPGLADVNDPDDGTWFVLYVPDNGVSADPLTVTLTATLSGGGGTLTATLGTVVASFDANVRVWSSIVWGFNAHEGAGGTALGSFLCQPNHDAPSTAEANCSGLTGGLDQAKAQKARFYSPTGYPV